MENEFEQIDYLGEARERVTEQFKEKPVFDRYLQLLLAESIELQTQLDKLMKLRSIDTATGKQLDIIGDIVGRERGLVTSDYFKYFGFQGNAQAESFGSSGDNTVGGPFWSLDTPLAGSRPPTDEEYRLLIKSKIIKNTTRATPEDTIRAFQFLFNNSKVFIDEAETGSVKIGIGKQLTPVEKGLLFEYGGVGNLLPKTVGIRFEFLEFSSSRVFATEGFPNAFGVGDLNDPSVGGYLANLLNT